MDVILNHDLIKWQVLFAKGGRISTFLPLMHHFGTV